jgi:hypothetical protein
MYAVYRKGRTHWVGDIQCEIARVELRDLEQYRSDGWVDNVEDIDKPKKPAKKADKE